jgi:hypothetical protein
MDYEVPSQDLEGRLTDFPAQTRSRFVITGNRARSIANRCLLFGARPEPAPHAVHWTNVDFRASDTVEIANLHAPNVAGHAVKAFCATFNHGDLMSMTGSATTLEGDVGATGRPIACGVREGH